MVKIAVGFIAFVALDLLCFLLGHLIDPNQNFERKVKYGVAAIIILIVTITAFYLGGHIIHEIYTDYKSLNQ